ncbi:MAG: ATP-dependent Clp protease proteolytic subunit [Lachnospiraceae bacterium]|nr:ATP-dependent Clp protease proteolytic subunit [Lachnospiraceae bacterium]
MDEVKEYGQGSFGTAGGKVVRIVTIIGEIEGHDVLSGNTKATKYEHLIPQLIEVDNDKMTDGILFVLNTIGGDVECGLAIAELMASLHKPTVSLVIGGSHSIGIPLAVSAKYSFLVPSATMMVHPVRMSGTVVGAPQTYFQFYQMQERIVNFIVKHCKVEKTVFEELMLSKNMMAKDLGTVLVGQEAVDVGLIDEVGGLENAIKKLEDMMGTSPA